MMWEGSGDESCRTSQCQLGSAIDVESRCSTGHGPPCLTVAARDLGRGRGVEMRPGLGYTEYLLKGKAGADSHE